MPLDIRNYTQKSKFLLSQALKWKKIMFFVIPEMPFRTFVMVKKKNFLITLRNPVSDLTKIPESRRIYAV